jgi:translation elongation factor EF-1beta
MEGRALTWYNWLTDSGYTGGWEDFASALKTRFAPSVFDDPVGTFTTLKQTTTVEDFQNRFEILSNRIQGLSEDFKVSTFLSGLKEEIRITVTILKPKDLTIAFGLARLQEEVKMRSRGHTYQTWVTNSQEYTKLATAPDPVDPPLITASNLVPETRNTNHSYPTNFNKRPSIPIKILIPAQMQERREN